MEETYYVYIVRCVDNSLYTGITTDVQRRLSEHAEKGPRTAKYTASHPAVALCCAWNAFDRQTASQLEYRIKRLSKAKKEQLIQEPSLINRWFEEICKGRTLLPL